MKINIYNVLSPNKNYASLNLKNSEFNIYSNNLILLLDNKKILESFFLYKVIDDPAISKKEFIELQETTIFNTFNLEDYELIKNFISILSLMDIIQQKTLKFYNDYLSFINIDSYFNYKKYYIDNKAQIFTENQFFYDNQFNSAFRLSLFNEDNIELLFIKIKDKLYICNSSNNLVEVKNIFDMINATYFHFTSYFKDINLNTHPIKDCLNDLEINKIKMLLIENY